MASKVGARVLLAAALLATVTAAPAHAYLDPASGSMFLQLVLGGAAGLAVAVRLLWRRLTGRFGGDEGTPDASPDSAPEAPPDAPDAPPE